MVIKLSIDIYFKSSTMAIQKETLVLVLATLLATGAVVYLAT